MFKSNYWKEIIGLFILIIVVGCSPLSIPEPTSTPVPELKQVVLKISGSGSATAILDAIAPAFEVDNPGYSIEVLSGSGTGGGVKGIVGGVLDVAAMARPPKPEEAEQNVEYFQFGESGVAVLTHPKVNVSNLSAEQIKAIFSGEVSNWSEVGGKNEPIILYVRDEGDSSTKALKEVFLGDVAFSETAQIFTSQGDMLIAVAGTPNSIGLGTWATARAKDAQVKAIMVGGFAPNDSAYPMTSPLGIGYMKDRKADVQPLIDWLNSEEGQMKLQEYDLITVK